MKQAIARLAAAVLELGGLASLVAAAWMIGGTPAALVVTGCACLYLARGFGRIAETEPGS